MAYVPLAARSRRCRVARWLVLGALLALAAACSSGHPVTSPTVASSRAPMTTPSPTEPTVSPTGPGGGPVGAAPPPDFAPAAASFLTGRLGFVLGLTPCRGGGSTLCPALLRTADGGQHWNALTPPPLLVLTDPARHPLLRFADALDGVASDAGPGSPLALTHDGGRTWTLRALPRAADDAQVTALASDGGRFVLTAGDATGQRLWTATAGSDAYAATGPTLPGTASPVSLALAAGGGWVSTGPQAATGRATYARSTDGGVSWRPATTPCAAGQRAALSATVGTAAPVTPAVVMVCQSAPRGLRAARRTYVSSDGGAVFAARGSTGGEGYLAGIAAASPTTVAVATSAVTDNLLRSGDGARSFALTYSSQAGGVGQGLYDLAFSDARAGSVVLGSSGSYALQLTLGIKDAPTTRLLLTTDGGGHWTQAVFAR